MPYTWSKFSHVVPKFNIFFDHESEYESVEYALLKIKSGKNGSSILEEINAIMNHENQLNIMVDCNSNSEVGGELTQSQSKKYSLNIGDEGYLDKVTDLVKSNVGIKPMIYYNPLFYVFSDQNNKSWLIKDKKNAFISLAHEMIHAFHLLNGTSKSQGINSTYDATSTQLEEEERAIGIGKYQGSLFSENAVRIEHEISLRTSFFTENAY